jgi:protein transport protein SEC24
MLFSGEVKYDDKLTEEDGVYIQAALLFTSCSGQRRLRVINLSLNTSSSMADMYRNCKSLLRFSGLTSCGV